MADEELRSLVAQLVEPTETEVMRAKRLMLTLLDEGNTAHTDALLTALAAAEGLPNVAGEERLSFNEGEFSTVVTADNPLIRRERFRIASLEALGDLFVHGLVVAVGTPLPAFDSTIRIGFNTPSRGDSVAVSRPVPQPSSSAFRFPKHLAGKSPLHLEPDLFIADLSSLALDPRTQRCIVEALSAYRRGLYLAAASLIGAASEGAWYAAADRLRARHASLTGLIGQERTAPMQVEIARIVREALPSGQKWRANDVETHAALLRALRNYGVHPTGTADADLDHYFTAERCGLLLLNTYRYLIQLAELVDAVP